MKSKMKRLSSKLISCQVSSLAQHAAMNGSKNWIRKHLGCDSLAVLFLASRWHSRIRQRDIKQKKNLICNSMVVVFYVAGNTNKCFWILSRVEIDNKYRKKIIETFSWWENKPSVVLSTWLSFCTTLNWNFMILITTVGDTWTSKTSRRI